MPNISDADKLGMASLLASMGGGQTVNRAKKADKLPMPPKAKAPKRKKITLDDINSGRVSEGDANDEIMLQGMKGFKNGGKIDGVAMKGKTRGRIC
jgi:hypothetical protein